MNEYMSTCVARSKPVVCPACRAPFTPGPPDLIELFLEFDEEEEGDNKASTSANGALSKDDKRQILATIEAIDELGVESSAADLENTEAKAEMLSLRLQNNPNDETASETAKVSHIVW